jgi:hypothetical protein
LQIPGQKDGFCARKLPKQDHIDVAFTRKTRNLRDGSPAKGTLNMTDSAERPLIGPETANDAGTPGAIDAAGDPVRQDHDQTSVPPALEQARPGWRMDACDDAGAGEGYDRDDFDEDDDGPVIRRIRSPQTPGMFSRQLGAEPGYDCGEFDPLAGPPLREHDPVHRPDAHARLAQPYPRNARRHEHEEFSVAAIREKRMRRPAGTHTPTRLGTKLTVAALASACMISAGVALGLYGQDMGRIIEQQARVAGTAVNTAIGQVVSAAVSSLDQGSEVKAETGQDSNAVTASAAPEATAQPATPATGRKLIYKRLPTAVEKTADAPDTQRQVRTVNAASLGGIEQLLAPPADFAPSTSAVD